jgi:hypothetical protein
VAVDATEMRVAQTHRSARIESRLINALKTTLMPIIKTHSATIQSAIHSTQDANLVWPPAFRAEAVTRPNNFREFAPA